jgi:DNA polymerase-3 subunit delta
MKILKPDLNCYLIVGEDEWQKTKLLNQLKTKWLDPSAELMNYTLLEDKETTFENIEKFGETMPFFAEKKLLVLKDSGLFKPGRKEESEKLYPWLKTLPDYLVVLFLEQEVDKRSKLYKLVQTTYEVVVADYPGDAAAGAIIEAESARYGITFSKSLLKYFIDHMAKNIGSMLIELDKLANYLGSGEVTQAAIDLVCSFSLEERVFEMIKALVKKDTTAALKIYYQLLERKESPIGMLVLLGRQYRLMLQAKYMMKKTADQKLLAGTLGVPPFVAKELMVQSGAFTFKQLEGILADCLATDQAIKTGQMTPEYGVEWLILHCSTMVSTSR